MISRLADFLKGILSLAMLVGLLVGVPILLLVIVGYPFPTERPSIDLIRAHLEAGDIPDAFIIKALAVVVWIVWAQLAVAFLTEAFAMARGRVARRAPVLPGVQLLAGKLVASSILIISAFLPSRAATAAPIHPITVADIAYDAGVGAPPVGLGGPVGPSADMSRNGLIGTTGTGVVGDGAGVSASAASADGHYETQSGDSWWDMAERLLGDGMRWSELRDLNSGKTMLTGEVLSANTEEVKAGWLLDVPTDANAALLVSGPANTGSEKAAASELVTELAGDPAESPGMSEDLEDVMQDQAEAPVPQGQEIPVSSPLIEAIKPFSLVYEGPTGATPSGTAVPYQVVAGDNLWDIAERHLGDPFRWPEIYENSTGLTQTFGRTIDDPNLIWPDSIVLLPADAVDVPIADATLVAEVVTTPVGVADGSAGTGGADAQDGALQPEDLRGATAAAEAGLSPDWPDGPTPDPDPDAQLVSEARTDAEQGETDEGLVAAVTGPAGLAFGAGGMMVATGFVGMLQRSRRLRQSEAGARTIPEPPPMELIDIETVLRNGANGRESTSVHAIVASLADRSVIPGEPVAVPEVIRVGVERVEAIQSEEDPDLPSPWLAVDNAVGSSDVEALAGRSLAVLPSEFFPENPTPKTGPDLVTPTVVTVGGGLLLNLESVGVIAIDGTVEAAAGLVRSMVHELATGPAKRTIDIRVSDWLPGADLHDHVRCGPLDGLPDEFELWFEDVDLAMTAAGGMSAYAIRAAGRAGSIPNPKVIFADAADVAKLGPILDRASRRTMPLAVVLSGDLSGLEFEPGATVSIDGAKTSLLPYGVAAATQHLETDLILGAEALITHARQAPMVQRNDDQATILPHADHPTDPAQVPTEETPEHEIVTERPAEEHEVTDQADDGESGMLIRVLGPVQFEGGPDDLSEEERSIVAFLAVVGPSTPDQLRDAIRPDESHDDGRFAAVLTSLQQRFGLSMPEPVDGRYRVRSIITDLGSARRWLTQAEAMTGDRSRNLIELALAEVRGAPFEGVEPRYWQWIEDHKMAIATQASSMLIDACFDLCDTAYGTGDIALAKWACEVASLIDPIHETVAIRRVQLMGVSGEGEEAAALVEEWEARYPDLADRPAPSGPRAALQPREVVAPHVG